MRILAVILTLCTYFWPCIIIYLVAWMVIPVARTPREILEMQGQPVTLDNIGQTVINNSVPPAAPIPNENSSTVSANINTFFSVAAKLIIGFFGVVFGLGALAIICVLLAAVAGITLFAIAGNPVIIEGLSWADSNAPILESWGYICVLIAVLIPCVAVARYACIPIFKAKAPSTSIVITTVIFEVIFIVAAVVLLAIAEHSGNSYTDSWACINTIVTDSAPITGLISHSPFLSIHDTLLAAVPTAALIAPSIAA